MPEFDDTGRPLDPWETADRNKKREQQQRERQEAETRERLQILRQNENIAEKIDDLQERLRLNGELDAKFQRDENAYATLKSKTEEYQKTLRELQEAVKNRPKDKGGGNETEILELLASVLDMEEKLTATEREKAKTREELDELNRKHRELQDQAENLRQWGNRLNDQMKRKRMDKETYQDDEARISKLKGNK